MDLLQFATYTPEQLNEEYKNLRQAKKGLTLDVRELKASIKDDIEFIKTAKQTLKTKREQLIESKAGAKEMLTAMRHIKALLEAAQKAA